MNYATIKPRDIANGPGVRVSLFVSGCTHRCPGCFNSEAWDFDYGQPFDQTVIGKAELHIFSQHKFGIFRHPRPAVLFQGFLHRQFFLFG